MTAAHAPGKIILFGEHSVVYGEPAIAIPVSQVRATADVTDASHGRVLLKAPDLGEDWWLDEAPEDHPLAAALRVLENAANTRFSNLDITLTSTIPIASGMGSGAAIAAALIRALAMHTGLEDFSADAAVSQLTFEVEKIHHGSPSGIDNTVVSYAQPVYFVRAGAPIKTRVKEILDTFEVSQPLLWLIGDTGVKAPTKESVGDVRKGWEANPAEWEPLFEGCGDIAENAKPALEAGDLETLGRLMRENHALLRWLTVSSNLLDKLVGAALTAGAYGAKLSGGGRGGNMIALVDEASADDVEAALLKAGARSVLHTWLGD